MNDLCCKDSLYFPDYTHAFQKNNNSFNNNNFYSFIIPTNMGYGTVYFSFHSSRLIVNSLIRFLSRFLSSAYSVAFLFTVAEKFCRKGTKLERIYFNFIQYFLHPTRNSPGEPCCILPIIADG